MKVTAEVFTYSIIITDSMACNNYKKKKNLIVRSWKELFTANKKEHTHTQKKHFWQTTQNIEDPSVFFMIYPSVEAVTIATLPARDR